MKPLHIALIGCGAISQAHLQWLAAIPEARVVALVDPLPEAIERAKTQWLRSDDASNVQTYADHRAMLDAVADHVDAAIVLTPHAHHYQPIHDCLDAHLHVLSEKPLATNSHDATELIKLARQRGRILMTAFQFPLLAPYRYAREMISGGSDGALGQLEFVSASLSMDWTGIDTPWRTDRELAGGGALLDSGSHLIDLILYLSGARPVKVMALTDNRASAVDIVSTLNIQFDGAFIGSISMIGHGPWEWNIKFVGTKSALIFRDVEDLLHIDASDYDKPLKSQRKANRLPHIDQLPPTITPADAFVHCALADDLGASNGDRALAVLHVVEAAYESARTGKAVNVTSIE